MPPAPIVFFDIAGPGATKLADFYEMIFGWQINRNTPFPGADAIPAVPVVAPLPGTLRGVDAGDDPQFRKVIYIGVDDINATMAKITAAGGSVHQPRFEVPGVVILGLFKDPAGNLLGLVEMKDGKVKSP